MKNVAEKVFGQAAPFLNTIEDLLPAALQHRYRFSSDESFDAWRNSDKFEISQLNALTSLELVDKAHLAATTALIRTKSWADAVCLTYQADNFLGWASTARGLVENAGDVVDGLLQIAPAFAENHRTIQQCLSGKMKSKTMIFSALEKPLDHFVHAKWMRAKKGEEQPLKAKDNVEYVKGLETVIPGITRFYHRLCAICHPSNASIDYLYDMGTLNQRGFRLSRSKGIDEIENLNVEFPDVLAASLMMSCNPCLLILRVLHKFNVHPKIHALKRLDWDQIKMWRSIEKQLKN